MTPLSLGTDRFLALLLSLLLVAVLVPATGAAAQEREAARGWELEADGRYGSLVGDEFTAEEEGLGGHGVVRYAWASGFSLGLGGGYTSYDLTGATANLDITDAFLEGRWRLAGGSTFSPFLAGRAGYTRLSQAGAVDEGIKLSLTGGAEVWVSDHFAFHGGVVASPFDVEHDDFSDGVGLDLQAGFVISTGGRREAGPERPADTDRDGVPDARDTCPGTPVGTPVDADGCHRDADDDAVPDHEDECPGTAAGARVDRQGCAIDSDGDGVPDGPDACPDSPRGVEVDAEGCATDGDGDGVPDGRDACPDTPEGEAVDDEGCTEIEAGIQRGRLAVQDVHFAFASAELEAASREILDRVGQALLERPGVTIQIQGHTDSIGSERANREVSWARARSVRSYLLEQFPELDADRLVAVGMGETRPVATNSTGEGRAQNRRVEFVVVEATDGP